MEWMEPALRNLRALVWGPATTALLLGTGLFLSVRCGFPQLRRVPFILRRLAAGLRKKEGGAAGLSPAQAMTAALAGTVGTGNIAGVAGAILAGGPGAVVWMWISALLGMCTKFAEIALAVRYRETGDGERRGGPMYYISRGLGPRFRPLAALFAFCGGLAAFGIGNLTQSREIAGGMESLLGVPPPLTGAVLAALAALAAFGGVRRLGRVTEALVPLMAGLYLLAGLTVLALHLGELPRAAAEMLREAFSLRAAGGGLLGSSLARSMRTGLARGVFSNEAGLGSAPIVHAASDAEEPCDQAVWGMFEVFADTFVICTVTALTVLLSGVAETPARFSSPGAAAEAAFRTLLPAAWGGGLIRVCLMLFALSTILAWSCIGARCWEYLCGGRRVPGLLYRAAFCLACIPGAMGGGERIWAVADILNGLMTLPNLAALLLLSGEAAEMAGAYFKARDT